MYPHAMSSAEGERQRSRRRTRSLAARVGSHRAAAGAASLALALCASCSSLRLKELDQDMPLALVESYTKKNDDYADDALFWFPPLLIEVGHVARTERGFTAKEERFLALGAFSASIESAVFGSRGKLERHREERGMGLGLLTLSKSASVYDASGDRQRYESETCLLLGLLGASKHTEEGASWKKSSTLLLGLLGTEESSGGASALQLFWWIRIPLAQPAPAEAAAGPLDAGAEEEAPEAV
jgi:hypothetical protein